MKILISVFEICDYGGIVNHVELLARGLKEHGHEVSLIILRDSDRDVYIRKAEGPSGSDPSFSGGRAHTINGWYGVPVMGYGSPSRIRAWQSFANGFDLVIHEVPGPKLPDGPVNYDWHDIYNLKVKQIVAAHDAHFRDMYPHIREVADRITAITCTQQAGYEALSWCPIPRSFVGAPHVLLDWTSQQVWSNRPRYATCAHVWKAWKRMDKVVRAAPLVTKGMIHMGGDGIEGRYMRSKEKCKPKYKGIWQAALDLGTDRFMYHGLIDHEALFALYQDSRVMIDLSFSEKFFRLGNHFNRSCIEAYNTGMVPLCTLENMYEKPSQRPLFVSGENYLAIPAECDSEDIAGAIDWSLDLSPTRAAGIIAAGREILCDHFDYRKVALQYHSLASGRHAGIYPNPETGRWPQ